MIGRSIVLLLFAGLLFPRLIFSAESDDKQLQAIVAKAADEYEKRFAERDAKGLAALFTSDAEYVDSDGTIFHGRDAILAELAAQFASGVPGKLTITISSIRQIAPGVVIEDGSSAFTPQDDGPITHNRYTVTHVKQTDGTWLMASARELSAERISPHERLKELAWLVGEWREEVDGTSIATKWNWSPDGSFLISDFTVRQSRDQNWQGTHRIGWDAERKQFRSWIFESSGGIGEGWWSAEDDAYSVHLITINPIGVRTSATLRYAPDGKDAIVVTLSNRTRAGVTLPGAEHRIVRKPPTPAAATSAAK